MILQGFIGTYTKKDSRGIYSFYLNTDTKELEKVSLAAEIENPTYLAIRKDNRYLYSVARENDDGGVAAFSLGEKEDRLTEINRQLAPGAPPCYVSVNNKGDMLFSANYHKGTIALYALNEKDGSIKSAPYTVKHHRSGPDPRQGQARVHFAAFDPGERYVIAVDLGSDLLVTYKTEEGILQEVARLTVKDGSGPRHLVFHPGGTFAYIMTEFSSEVIALAYDPKNGTFRELQYISTISPSFRANNQGSAIHISRDGKFLYAGNRGENTIAVFKIDGETGKIELIDRTPTEGNWPRDFTLDPTERFIVAANQESDNIVLFERDPDTGRLTLLPSGLTVSSPVCIKFLH